MSRPSLLKKFWLRSQTKVWSYIQLGGSGVLFSIKGINDTVSNPTFKSYLDQLDLPKTLLAGLAIFGLITFLVHGHGED